MHVTVYMATGVKCSWNHRYPWYDYVSRTGEIGYGDDWCQVPERFRLWVLSQKREQARYNALHPVRIIHNPGFDGRAETVPDVPPLAAVTPFTTGMHRLDVIDDTRHDKSSIWPMPYGTDGCEVQYAVGRMRPDVHLRWKDLMVWRTTRDYRWPPPYVGKTITYRFRWKFRDGSTGPWSKPVSAKVLP